MHANTWQHMHLKMHLFCFKPGCAPFLMSPTALNLFLLARAMHNCTCTPTPGNICTWKCTFSALNLATHLFWCSPQTCTWPVDAQLHIHVWKQKCFVQLSVTRMVSCNVKIRIRCKIFGFKFRFRQSTVASPLPTNIFAISFSTWLRVGGHWGEILA